MNIEVSGTASVRFNTVLDVDIDELVGDFLSDNISFGGGIELEDVEIDEVSAI
jgi:hypothetical protein